MFQGAEQARDQLYDTFESTVKELQRKAGVRNLMVERRLEQTQDKFEKKQAQFQEVRGVWQGGHQCVQGVHASRGHSSPWWQVLNAANLDPALFTTVTHKLDEVLDQRNALIRDLKYQIARVTKSHNDVARTYSARLEQLGIPSSEVDVELAPTRTALGPAGLVASNV